MGPTTGGRLKFAKFDRRTPGGLFGLNSELFAYERRPTPTTIRSTRVLLTFVAGQARVSALIPHVGAALRHELQIRVRGY